MIAIVGLFIFVNKVCFEILLILFNKVIVNKRLSSLSIAYDRINWFFSSNVNHYRIPSANDKDNKNPFYKRCIIIYVPGYVNGSCFVVMLWYSNKFYAGNNGEYCYQHICNYNCNI